MALMLDILSGHEDLVTANLGVDDLGDDVLVGEADDEAVLGRIVLVLGLSDQPLASIVVGCARLEMEVHGALWMVRTLALSAALVLDLVPREVRVVLLEFGLISESAIDASNPHSKQLAKTRLDSRRGGRSHDEDVQSDTAENQGILTKGMLGCLLLVVREDDCWRKVRGRQPEYCTVGGPCGAGTSALKSRLPLSKVGDHEHRRDLGRETLRKGETWLPRQSLKIEYKPSVEVTVSL